MPNPLNPSPALLAALGSLIVHAEEMISTKGHEFDIEAFKSLLNDNHVQEWLKEMRKLALLPEKRFT